MGTSSPFGGQRGGTPLVPSWLGDDGSLSSMPDGADPDGQSLEGNVPDELPLIPPIPPLADPDRFFKARNNFSRFAASGGSDRRSLARAISHYVGSTVGGARTAAARMGASRVAGSRLLGFLSETVSRGATEALRSLNLVALAGRPIEEIFLGLVDFVCPDGGSIDDGIAREAFIETITDLAGAGISDLDGLTADQMQTVFELYATNSIEARLCNDIGLKTIILPLNIREVAIVQVQLHDFIRRGVADALTIARAGSIVLTPDRVLDFVGRIYEQAFGILQVLGNTEAT